MSELIDWVEKQALENLRFRIQDADNLTKESNTTLTILLAAMGAGVAYTVKLLEADGAQWLILGAFLFSGYMLILSMVLLFTCMKISAIPAPTNEPRNLFQKSFRLEQVREIELQNIQQRIDQAVARNDATATWLNRVRLLAISSPLIFGAALAWAEL